VLDLFAASMVMKPLHVKCAIVQAARSESIAWYDGGRPIAAAMLYPLEPERPGERLVELAFVCLPELRRHMLAFVRLAHLTRDRLANDGPVRVRAHVRTGHRPGSRMATMLGMRLVGTFGGFERYEFEGAEDGRIRVSGTPGTHWHRSRRGGEQADDAGHLRAG
jgi:hypothetical protein